MKHAKLYNYENYFVIYAVNFVAANTDRKGFAAVFADLISDSKIPSLIAKMNREGGIDNIISDALYDIIGTFVRIGSVEAARSEVRQEFHNQFYNREKAIDIITFFEPFVIGGEFRPFIESNSVFESYRKYLSKDYSNYKNNLDNVKAKVSSNVNKKKNLDNLKDSLNMNYACDLSKVDKNKRKCSIPNGTFMASDAPFSFEYADDLPNGPVKFTEDMLMPGLPLTKNGDPYSLYILTSVSVSACYLAKIYDGRFVKYVGCNRACVLKNYKIYTREITVVEKPDDNYHLYVTLEGGDDPIVVPKASLIYKSGTSAIPRCKDCGCGKVCDECEENTDECGHVDHSYPPTTDKCKNCMFIAKCPPSPLGECTTENCCRDQFESNGGEN